MISCIVISNSATPIVGNLVSKGKDYKMRIFNAFYILGIINNFFPGV